MRTTVRLLLAFAIVSLVALPAQAHTIGIRGTGTGSTLVCDGEGEAAGTWAPLEFNATTGFFEAEFENNCFEEIFSMDFQLGSGDFPTETIVPTHPPGGVEPSPSDDNMFDSVDGPFLNGEELVYRFFSSDGNTIGCGTCGIITLLESSFVSSPHFFFFVDPDGDPAAEWVRIVDINQEVVPEPATLLLLGSGLGAALLKRRRR